jgi:oligoendopeptidase F
VLDEKGERILSLAGPTNQAPRTVYEELSTSDIQFPTLSFSDGQTVKLAPGAYAALLESNRNQADRAKAAEAHLKTYGANAATYAAIYKGVLERDWFVAQARNFPTTLDAALFGNAIPRAVVENLISRHARRHGAAAALHPAAPEAAGTEGIPHLRQLPAAVPHRQEVPLPRGA